MKILYTLSASLCLACSLSYAAPQRLLQYETWYGDNMGETSETTATKRIEYLYDAQNHLSRRIQTGLLTAGGWVLTNYYRYDLNEAGNPIQTNSIQYGLYDQLNYSFQASSDTVCYEYNEAGLCSKMFETARNRYFLYEYDAEGRMTRQECWVFDTYNTKTYILNQAIEYSDFTTGGPQTIHATSTKSYNRYNGTITYDEQGHKTSEKHWTVDDDPVLSAAEYWTYDEQGNLTLYEKKAISKGQEIDGTKIEYEQIDADNVRSKTYTYGNGKWSMKGGSTELKTYATFDGDTAPALSVSVDPENASNVIYTLTPQPNAPADATYRIYRNGLLVAEVPATQTTYTERNVHNGDYECFAQAVIGNVSQNISGITSVSVSKALPHATQLHASTARISTDGYYYVTLNWTNPVITPDLEYVDTNVLQITKYGSTPMLVEKDVITDPTQNTVEVSFGIDKVLTICLQHSFTVGRAVSDTITVDATKLIGKVSDDTRKLRVIETWGDAMGQDNGITKKEIVYYGDDDREQRRARYAKTLGTEDDWTIYEYTTTLYGEDRQPAKQFTQQYGRYDYGDMGFKAPQDTTFFEYNLEGQKTRESDSYGYTTYEYGTDGSLVREEIVQYGSETLTQTITYSDFIGTDKPRHTESTGNLNSYKWTIDSEYDANGNISSTRTSKYDSYSDVYKPSEYHLYIYDQQSTLTSDTVYTIKVVNDVETYSYKSFTTYTPEESNPNRIDVVKKVWDNILKKFGNPKTWNVYEYTDINAEKYAPTLEVTPVEEAKNTVDLTVQVPSSQRNAMTAFNIYRHGTEIAHAVSYYDDRYYQTDEYGMNGVFVYRDAKVKNGNWDYYVEYCHLDASMQNVEKICNVSNVVTSTFDLALPCPTGLHEVSRRSATASNTDTGSTELSVFVTLGWDDITNKAEFGFERYNVLIAGVQLPDNDGEEGQDTSYELAMRGLDSLQVYIQAVYEYGRANGDTILVTEKGEAGIRSFEADTDAQVLVFSLDGRLVATLPGLPESSALAPGNYILITEKNGRRTATLIHY